MNVSGSFPTSGAGALFSATATTNNENGSNQQLFTASSGTFAVRAANANGLNTFAKPGQAKHLETNAIGTGGAGKLQTLVDFKGDGGGDTVAITDGTNPSGKYACPAGQTCQADYSEVLFSRTDFGAPYFKWSLTAQVPKTYTLARASSPTTRPDRRPDLCSSRTRVCSAARHIAATLTPGPVHQP